MKEPVCILCLCVALVFASCPNYNAQTYQIGGLFATVDSSAPILEATALWAVQVVNSGGILASGSTLTFSSTASLVNSPDAGNASFWSDAGVLAVIDASDKVQTANLASVLTPIGISQLVAATASTVFSDTAKFPTLLRLFPPGSRQASAYTTLFSFLGWRRAALLYPNDTNYYNIGSTLRSSFGAAGFTILETPRWPVGSNVTVLSSVLSVAAERYARLFIVLAGPNDVNTVFEAAYALGLYGDGYVYLLTHDFYGQQAAIASDQALTVAVGSLVLRSSPGFKTRDQQIFPMLFQNQFPSTPPPLAAPWVYDSVMAVARAISQVQANCLPVNNATVGLALRNVSFSGATGWVIFNNDTNDRPGGLYEVVNIHTMTHAPTLGVIGFTQISPTQQAFADYVSLSNAMWNGRSTADPPSCKHYTLGGTFYFASNDSVNSIDSVLMALDEINDLNLLGDGDVIEMPFDFIVDDNCDAVQGAVAATQLANSITEEGTTPFGLIGLTCSGVTLATYPIFSAAGMAAIGFSASEKLANPAVYPLYARMIPATITAANAMLSMMQYYGVRQIAVFGTSEAYGASAVNSVLTMAPTYGIKVTISALWPQRSPRSVVQQALQPVQSTGTRIICVFAQYDDNIVFFEAVFAMGLYGPNYFYVPQASVATALVDDGLDPSFFAGLEGAVAMANKGSSPIANRYVSKYMALFDREPFDQDPFMYDAAYAFANGIISMKRLGFEPPFVPTDFMNAVRDNAFDGATGRVSYPDQPSANGNDRQGAAWALLNIYNGTFDVVLMNNAAHDIPGQQFYVYGNVSFYNDSPYLPRSCPHGSASGYAIAPPPFGGQIIQACSLCPLGTFAASGSTTCAPCPEGFVCPFASRVPLSQVKDGSALVYTQPIEVGPVTDPSVLTRITYFYLGIGLGLIFVMVIILAVLRYACKTHGRRVKLLVQKWDIMFVEKHSFEGIGESTIKRQTAIGGIFTVTFFLLALIVLGYLVHRYLEDRYVVSQSTEAGTANFTNPFGFTISVVLVGDNLPELCTTQEMSSTFAGGTFSAATSLDGLSCTASYSIPRRKGLLPVSTTVTFSFPAHKAYAIYWTISTAPVPFRPAASVSGVSLADSAAVLTGANATIVEIGLQPQRFEGLNYLNSSTDTPVSSYFPIITSETIGSQANASTYWNAQPGLFISFVCTRSSLVQVLSVDYTESYVNLLTQIISFLSAVLSVCGLGLVIVEKVFRRAKQKLDDRKRMSSQALEMFPPNSAPSGVVDNAVVINDTKDDDVMVDEMVFGQDFDNVVLQKRKSMMHRLQSIDRHDEMDAAGF